MLPDFGGILHTQLVAERPARSIKGKARRANAAVGYLATQHNTYIKFIVEVVSIHPFITCCLAEGIAT